MFALFLFATPHALAGNLNLDLPGVELTSPNLPQPYQLNLGIQDEKFLVSPGELNAYNNFTEAKVRIKAESIGTNFKSRIDVGGTYALNVSGFGSFYAPEAFFSYYRPNLEISLGRRFFNWNRLDSYWELGLWQTDFKWNYLEPVEQGLTGLFVDLHNNEWKFLYYVSPLFIPEQTAPYNLTNGVINSQSPWFSPPAKYVQLFSGVADIRYNLVLPETSKIVGQFSTGLALQWEPKPFSVKISYVYKPRNSLALPVNAYLALQPNGSDAPVSIYPKVVYHHLAGIDLNYQAKSFSIWMSALAEFIVNPNFDTSLTYQQLSNQVLYSPGFEWVPFDSIYSTKFGASLLLQTGGDVADVGSLSSPGSNIFAYPLDYRDATQVRIAQPIVRDSSQALDFNLKWIEEFHDQSTVLMAELNYQYALLNIFGGANLLGSSADVSNSGFVPRYRDNSLVYAGASLRY